MTGWSLKECSCDRLLLLLPNGQGTSIGKLLSEHSNPDCLKASGIQKGIARESCRNSTVLRNNRCWLKPSLPSLGTLLEIYSTLWHSWTSTASSRTFFNHEMEAFEMKIVLIKPGPHSVISRIFPPASLCSLGLKLFVSILTSVLLSVGLVFFLNQLKPILVILSNVNSGARAKMREKIFAVVSKVSSEKFLHSAHSLQYSL